MSLSAGVIAPHPPILIPQIGGENLNNLKATVAALEQASALLDRIGIEALVVVSPHSPLFKDRFVVRADKGFEADFDRFGATKPRFMIDNDIDAVEILMAAARSRKIPLVAMESPAGGIDWGVSVPYSYLGEGRPVVSLSLSGLSFEDHFELGRAVADGLASRSEKRWAFIASGDLSHRLSPDGPYGFSARGLEFDRLIADIVSRGRLAELKAIDADLIDAAGECGLRSFIMLAGAMSGYKVETEVLSYEGPFGVGYMVATLNVNEGEKDGI